LLARAPSILLGLLWALWHLPVINYLGTATPHGVYWLPFFLAFTLAMTAMRVLIAWIYTKTNSVLLTQLMHISSTGSLGMFSAPRVTAVQEVIWHALYGGVLWVAVAVALSTSGRRQGSRRKRLPWTESKLSLHSAIDAGMPLYHST
jgi:uncharacterized protein